VIRQPLASQSGMSDGGERAGGAHGFVVREERVFLGAELSWHALAVGATLPRAGVVQRHAHAQPGGPACRPQSHTVRRKSVVSARLRHSAHT
jgi:hypothetical protein